MNPTLHIRSVHMSRKSRSSSPYLKKAGDDDVSCISQVSFDFSTTSSMVSDRTCDYPASSLTRMLSGGHVSLAYADSGQNIKYRPQQAKERKTAKPSCLSKKKTNECEVLDFMTPFSRQPSKKSLYEDDEDDFQEQEESSAQKQEQAEAKSTSSLSPVLHGNDEEDDDEEDGPQLPTITAATSIPDALSVSSMESNGQQQRHQLQTNSLYNDTDEESMVGRAEKQTSPWSSRPTSPSSVESTEAVVVGKEIFRRSFSSQMSELSDVQVSDIQECPTGDDLVPPIDALPMLVRAQRRAALRDTSDSVWEKRRRERAARLDRAKERVVREKERVEEMGRSQLERTDAMIQA